MHRGTLSLLAAFIANGCYLNPALAVSRSVVETPEETIAFLLFGMGYKDPCKAAYKTKSCPIRIGDHVIALNDGTYDHVYKISRDYCEVEARLVQIADGEVSSGLDKLWAVTSVTIGTFRYLGRSVEFQFVFQSEDPARTSDNFAYYHEYYAFSGANFQEKSQAELRAMNDALKRHQKRFCDKTS